MPLLGTAATKEGAELATATAERKRERTPGRRAAAGAGVRIVHAVWTEQGLFLWGEGPVPEGARRGRKPAASADAPHHPFAAPPDALAQLLAGSESMETGADSRFGGGPSSRTLLLPTANGRPLGSEEPVNGQAPALAPWAVAGVCIPPGGVLDALLALAEDPGALAGPQYAGDLRYWRTAALLALELLAAERCLPALSAGADGYRARWEPLFTGPAAQQLALLAQAMPGAARCALPAGQAAGPAGQSAVGSGQPAGQAAVSSGQSAGPAGQSAGPAGQSAGPAGQSAVGGGQAAAPAGQSAIASPQSAIQSRGRVLNDFLATVLDATARAWLSAEPLPPRRGRRAASDDGARDWLAALRCSSPAVDAPAETLARLAEKAAAWTAEARPAAGGAFRTCFRLDAPDDEAAPWHLSYHLQALDDPSLMVPAKSVWSQKGASVRLLNRELRSPQEPFLADLGRASRIAPPVEKSLHGARPTAATLDATEAHQFLREWAWLLEESGFGVLVPPWWDRRRGAAARLGVRARVSTKGPGGQAPGGMGNVLEFHWKVALGDQELTAEELAQLAALKSPLVRLRGQWVELRPDQIDAALKFLQKRQQSGGGLMDAFRLALGEGEVAGLPVTGIEPVGPAKELFERLRAGDHIQPLPAPAGLRATLRPYQERGLSWLDFLGRWGLGACLADDMGLGKTVEAIALLLRRKEAGQLTRPALLICPTSVIGNWQREVARFAPDLRVAVHHGPGRPAGDAFHKAAADADLVITSYALAPRDETTLAAGEWSAVILDEAQNIKNPSARQTQAIRKLRGDHRLALTGTPVENHLTELWSIMEFLNPQYLGSREAFRREFVRPIERAGDEDAARQLKQLVQPFILRRLKTDPTIIQDLPEKQEMKDYCPLTREQVSLYEAATKDAMEKIEGLDGMERRGIILATMMRLKQICNHPAQFLGDGSALPGRSGKLNRLLEMLDEMIQEGDRALVFTQYAEMGEMLQKAISTTFAREVFFLHGATSRANRDRMVKCFQEDPRAPAVFILSIKAGGVGLNLTAANHVFHFDRWWNPAVENQATDRAFRIGQKRSVQVHKFICAGTLEERIDELIEQKRALAEQIVGDGEGWLTELSTDEIRSLFALGRTLVEEG